MSENEVRLGRRQAVVAATTRARCRATMRMACACCAAARELGRRGGQGGQDSKDRERDTAQG